MARKGHACTIARISQTDGLAHSATYLTLEKVASCLVFDLDVHDRRISGLAKKQLTRGQPVAPLAG
jgi:hypothetical protein